MGRLFDPLYHSAQVSNVKRCWQLMCPGDNEPFLLTDQQIFDIINYANTYDDPTQTIEDWPGLDGSLNKEQSYALILSMMREKNDELNILAQEGE